MAVQSPSEAKIKREQSDLEERKEKRQQVLQQIRLPYSPALFLEMKKEEVKENPNFLDIRTRKNLVGMRPFDMVTFQEGRREKERSQISEERNKLNFNRRNPQLYIDTLSTMREIYGDFATKQIVFGFYGDWFLFYPRLSILRNYAQRVAGTYDVKDILSTIQSALKIIAKDNKFNLAWVQERERELGLVFSHQKFFFEELPEVLGEYHQSLLDGNDTALQETLSRIMEEYPRSLTRALFHYLSIYAESTPEMKDLGKQNKWQIMRRCAATLKVKLS